MILAVLAASLMIGALAISTQSYWIDEALSLIVAMSATPAEAWKYMQAVSGSTLQMPLYQIYLYTWHKIFGGGEWAMRASNLPWFILGQLAFLILLRHRPRLALLTCLLATVSPILWMYLDETRPYIMQYAAACWLGATVVCFSSSSTPPDLRYPAVLFAMLVASIILLFASSLLGIIWAGAYAAAIAFLLRGRVTTYALAPRNLWLIGLIGAALLVFFTLYYILTWSDAARGYHRSGVSLLSLPFVAYEFLGFSGFGPGKLQIRAEPLLSLINALPAFLPLVATLILLTILAASRIRQRGKNSCALTAWSLVLGVPTLVIFAGMFLFDHRPLPRHFIPALPALLLALAATLQLALEQKSFLWRTFAVLLPSLWLLSALSVRWQPAHAKDDYRTAAAVATAALRDDQQVWWAADPAAAYIYQTPIALEEVPDRAWGIQAPSWNDIRFKFPPDLIVLSKPDIYDPQGAIARYAAENNFQPVLQLQAFTILTREGQTLPNTPP